MTVVIDIVNEQDKLAVTEIEEKLIEDVIKASLENVAVTLTDDENIRLINNEQRNIDAPTDVLSFPVLFFEDGEMLCGVGDYIEDKLILGDVVLSLERAMSQSKEYGHSFHREMGYLVCHSILHLLGYDHENEQEREVMRQKEEETLERLSLKR